MTAESHKSHQELDFVILPSGAELVCTENDDYFRERLMRALGLWRE